MSETKSNEQSPDKPSFISSAVEQERIFYQAPPLGATELRFVCGGREKVAENYRIVRQSFPYLAIEWVAEGKGKLVLDGQPFDLKPGSLFLYGPGVAHEIATDPHRRLHKYFLDFEGPLGEELLRQYKLSPPCFHQLPLSCGVQELFNRIIETARGEGKGAGRLCRLLLESIFLLAAESYPSQEKKLSRAFQTFQRCRDYLDTNFHRGERIEDIARACHIDAAHMTRLFKRFSTVTPNRYLLEIRMRNAAVALHRRDALVKEIAHEVGYKDPFHFSRSFKKVYGVSPEHYARSIRS